MPGRVGQRDPVRAERLGRGMVSIQTADGAFLSWRLLAGDQPGTTFNVYRDGARINPTPLTVTNFQDKGAPAGATYTVRPVSGGFERPRPTLRWASPPPARTCRSSSRPAAPPRTA